MGKKTGAKIKEARTSAGMTQEQLARRIAGLSASDISKAERGELELTQTILKQIALETGVTQASLLNAEKATGSKSETVKKTSTASKKSSEDYTLTASEKKLIDLYRKADSETKKAAISLLKGEKNELQQLFGTVISGLMNSSKK